MYLRTYQGDPGFLSGLVGAVGKVAGGFLKGGPIGAVGAGVSLLTPRRNQMAQMPSRPAGLPALPGRGVMQGTGPAGRTPLLGLPVAGGCPTGYHPVKQPSCATRNPCAKNRRMNVANPRALRRAIRRQQGFVKLARRALKGSGYTIASRGSGRRKVSVRESGPGSVTVH